MKTKKPEVKQEQDEELITIASDTGILYTVVKSVYRAQGNVL